MDITSEYYEMSDHAWNNIKDLCSGRSGCVGRPAVDNRRFVKGVMYLIKSGLPWRLLPTCYGDWNTTHRRFRRWTEKGVWDAIFKILAQDADHEWLMIDATHCKAHQHSTGAVGGNEAMGITKGGNNTKVHVSVDSNGMATNVVITSGTVADCSVADELLGDQTAQYLIADKGYDSWTVIEAALKRGMEVVIPPRKNRIDQRKYDRYLYRLRHLVENFFQKMKQWRGLATRYCKKASSFKASVQLFCIMQWANII